MLTVLTGRAPHQDELCVGVAEPCHRLARVGPPPLQQRVINAQVPAHPTQQGFNTILSAWDYTPHPLYAFSPANKKKDDSLYTELVDGH